MSQTIIADQIIATSNLNIPVQALPLNQGQVFPTGSLDYNTVDQNVYVSNGLVWKILGGVDGSTTATIPNVAAFSTLVPVSNLESIILEGYTTPGDGGGGIFYYDPNDTSTPSNDGTVFLGPSGQRYKRIYSGPLNVKWFGATGNGSTDDTQAITNTITSASSLSVNVVFFPSGTYVISSYILLPSNITLYAKQYSVTITPLTGSTSKPYLFKVQGSTSNVLFDGIIFNGNMLGVTSNASLISVTNVTTTNPENIVFERCSFTNARGSFVKFNGALDSGVRYSELYNHGFYYQTSQGSPTLVATAVSPIGTKTVYVSSTGSGIDPGAAIYDQTNELAIQWGSSVSTITNNTNSFTIDMVVASTGIQIGDILQIYASDTIAFSYAGYGTGNFFDNNRGWNNVGPAINCSQQSDFSACGNILRYNQNSWVMAQGGGGIPGLLISGTG